MNDHDIKRYLEGKTLETETQEVIKWMKDPDNEAELREILGHIWMNSDIRLNASDPDFNRMLNKVHSQINSQSVMASDIQEKFEGKIVAFYRAFSKIAAILVLPLLLTTLYFLYNPGSHSQTLTTTSIREVYTKPGTRTRIELADGTQVWLNDGTTFRYPEQFSGKNREVYLDGEAYFEVKSDKSNPFIVDNPMMKTVVTGTHFNLSAYSSDQYFEATLLEGKVNLENKSHEVSMSPGQQVQFDALHKKIIQKEVTTENATAWIDGKLIFKDEKLETAIKKLARWYNVEIILSDPELEKYLLTATFQQEKLEQTLTLVSQALPIKYEFKEENAKSKIRRTIYMKKK